MFFSLSAVIAVLPFLVEAAPRSADAPVVSIPIHNPSLKRTGPLSLSTLRARKNQAERYDIWVSLFVGCNNVS